MTISPKALTVFATLEALRDDHPDIRYPLATLFEPDLAKFNGSIFDPGLVAAEINKQYHLGVTEDIIAGFADIFLARGWLRKIEGETRVALRVTCMPSAFLSEEEKQFAKTAEQLAREFRAFIIDIAPLNQVGRSDTEIVDMLVEWLLLLDRSGDLGLKTATTTYRLGKKIVLEVDDQLEGGAPSEDAFLSARFVEHLFNSNSELVPFLLELSEVGLVTEVVRDFQRPSNPVKKSDLKVYLDAPLALDFLGLSGKPPQVSIEIILNGIRKLGGEIRIFRESVDEMQSALYAVLSRPVPDRTGPTADALRRREVLEQFVRQVEVQPDKFLAAKGVAIVDENIDMYPHQHKFFSRNAYEQLYSGISWVKDDAARHHDAVIATIAFRKRTGFRTPDIFEAKHLVITRNPTFPGLARRVARENNYIAPTHVGPVVHQRQIATAVWLRVGLGKDKDIPRSYILSACRRVLTLRKNIVERVHNFKRALTEEQAEQLEVLLTSDRSAQILMDRTLGSAHIITANNIELLLDDMREAQISDLRAEQKKEIRELRRNAKRQTQLLSEDIEKSKIEKERAVAAREQAALEIDEVFDRALSAINRKIGVRRVLYGLGLAVAFTVALAIPIFITVQDTQSRVLLFIVVLVLSALVQFSPFVREKFLNARFLRNDERTFDDVMRYFGLAPDKFSERVRYTGNSFERLS